MAFSMVLLDLAQSRAQIVSDSRPITSDMKRSKKTAWRISSTSWVARKASTSPLGAASRNGARSAVTRSSPT